MTEFCIVKSGHHVSYDAQFLQHFAFKNLTIIFNHFLCGPPQSAGEGLYYRILQTRDESCIQCIFFYKTQWIPYHPHDYHPFYIYIDENHSVKFIIIDDGHHFSKLILPSEINRSKPIKITIFLPDHGLTNQLKHFGKIFEPQLHPLLPDQIIKWWQINNMAQLKLRTKLVDPWSPGLIPKKPSEKESLLFRSNHILPLKFFPHVAQNLRYTFRDEAICPVCKSLQTLDFMPVQVNTSLQKTYLYKALICQNGHNYNIRYNFQTAQIEYPTD